MSQRRRGAAKQVIDGSSEIDICSFTPAHTVIGWTVKGYQDLCAALLLFLCYLDSVAAQELIKIGYPSTSYTTLPIVAAVRNGFFAQEGLRVELIRMAKARCR